MSKHCKEIGSSIKTMHYWHYWKNLKLQAICNMYVPIHRNMFISTQDTEEEVNPP